jgi:hypothetical protein
MPVKRIDKIVDLNNRIQNALHRAWKSGSVDGDHHKMWVIDQMVRELTGCPIITETAKGSNGKMYEYETLGESEAYKEFVRNAKDGEDGPETYSWETGTPP